MRKLFLFAIILNFYNSTNAQDLIIKNDGKDTIKCVIIEDKGVFLNYRLFNSKDTTIFRIKTMEYDYYLTNKSAIKIMKKKGGYLSIEEFKNNNPSVDFDFEVQKRSDFDIAMVGGNDYKIISKDKTVKQSIIKIKLWAFCDDSCCYFNCKKEMGIKFYTMLTFEGNHAYFYALPRPKDKRNNGLEAGLMFGAVGGAASGAAAALERMLYYLDLESGSFRLYDNKK